MIKQPLRSRKAQLIGLAIVLIAVGLLGGAAVYLSNTSGNQISGMSVNLGNVGCPYTTTQDNEEIIIDGLVDCGGPSNGIIIKHKNIKITCINNGHLLGGGGLTDGILGSTFTSDYSNNVSVTDCEISNFQNGITLQAGAYSYFDNNYIHDNTDNGLFLGVADNSTITNNIIEDDGVCLFLNAGYSNVSNNEISGCSNKGINVGVQAEYSIISHNTITDPGVIGISIDTLGASLHTNITNNTITGPATSYGILVDAAYLNISYNILNSGGDMPYGFFVSSTAHDIWINRNNITSSDIDVHVEASSSNINVWLNNLLYGGVESFGTVDYCLLASDDVKSDEFGNYYAPSVSSTFKPPLAGINTCSDPLDGSLPVPYTGSLPLKCGADIIGKLVMDSDLINSTGGYSCSNSGLSVYAGNDSLTIDCNGYAIRGSNISSQKGIDLAEPTYIHITNCSISDFDTGIALVDAYYSNVTYSVLDNKGLDTAIDISTNPSGHDNYYFGNRFLGNGTQNYGYDQYYCFNDIGNNYTFYEENIAGLPPAWDCGYAWVNWTGPGTCGTKVNISTLNLLNNMSCSSGTALEVAHNNVTINCSDNYIADLGSASTGISSVYNRTFVDRCNISDFDIGILLDSGSSFNNISNNILYAPSDADMRINSDANFSDIWNNAFLSSGIDESINAENNYCVDISGTETGNFYKISIDNAYRGPDDCGYPSLDFPATNGTVWSSTTPASLFWNKQDAPIQPLYNITIDNLDRSASSPLYVGQTSSETIDLDPTNYWEYPLIYNTFTMNISPSVLDVDGNFTITEQFILARNTDNDLDGFTPLGEPADCDDDNDDIHPERDEVCSVTQCDVDFNCDGEPRWGDPNCSATKNGITFNPGDFDYNFDCGLDDLEAAQNIVLNHTNDLGAIHFLQPIDLNGTDLRDVTIAQNEIGIPISLTGLIGRQAVIEFRNLDFQKQPTILKNGVPCPTDSCLGTMVWKYKQDTHHPGKSVVNMTVASFSTYTLTNSSQLTVYDQNDSEVGEPGEIFNRITFYANYTRTIDNQSINDKTGADPALYHEGACNFTLFNWTGTKILDKMMNYTEIPGVYKTTIGALNFTQVGTYSYNITCNSTLYENATASDSILLLEDTRPPVAPTLYPQIELHPTNYTGGLWTTVAGYFGEPDILADINVLQGISSYSFGTVSNYSALDSEYKGESPIVNFNTLEGENVTFVAWSQEREDAFNAYDYIEFSGHNRSLFKRYKIFRANRTGNDIRVELYDDLEKNVIIGDEITLYNNPYPAGYFVLNVTLFVGGPNRISVWGTDLSGNSGNASDDWINAPYPSNAPPAPVFYNPPIAVNRSDFTLYGYLDATGVDAVNLSMVISQYPDINETRYDGSIFEHATTMIAHKHPSQDRTEGDDFIYLSDTDYAEQNTTQWLKTWISFSNHDLPLWKRYEVTATANYPAEDARIEISPDLDANITTGDLIYFWNNSYRHGFFNVSINTSIGLQEGMNTIYGVGFRDDWIEGPPSTYMDIYYDKKDPVVNLTTIKDYYGVRQPFYEINITDDFMINISSLNVSVNDTGNQNPNITCYDTYMNQSSYECIWTQEDPLENGNYTLWVFIKDMSGRYVNVSKNFIVNSTQVIISNLRDEDDITNDLWLYFNWTASPQSELNDTEFALGTAPWPDPDFNSVKDWNSTCDVFGDCYQNWVNFTHNMSCPSCNATELKFKTGTVYYLTVRARNYGGEYGNNATTDGILFIDQTPPRIVGKINDTGPWTNSNSKLFANWTFQDNESDIIEYQYAIGNATYPGVGYDSIVPPTLTSYNSTVRSGLALEEGMKYYWNVKARNGNVAMNYTGSWSQWQSSEGVTVDTFPPYGGWVWWTNQTYINGDSVTIGYNVGLDDQSTVNGMLQIGKGLLDYDVCPTINDFDWVNMTTYGYLSGTNFVDVNVTSGYCYVFRLFSWDEAGNSVTFLMPNESVRRIKVDTTPPTSPAPVLDDGFYTNSRTSLHASWTPSTDPESGFSHYTWRILEVPPPYASSCIINYTHPHLSTCDEISSGTTTNSEVSPINLNLTHNNKYFFEVYAWNKAGLNTSGDYSDGIIYLDNAAPDSLLITQVNNANHANSPYYTTIHTNNINVTAIGDTDGFNDISRCSLMPNNVDYTDQYPATNCSITPYQYWNATYENVTIVNCSKNTTSNPDGLEGIFSWYLSCVDHYGNAQTFATNTHVWFEVDWENPPSFNMTMSSTPAGNTSSDQIDCTADVWDLDDNLDTSSILFSWYVDGALVKTDSPGYTNSSGTTYTYSSFIDANDTYRGAIVECNVYAYDLTLNDSSDSAYMRIRNTPPSWLYLQAPKDDEVVKDDALFQWSGGTDIVDNDFITLYFRVENESVYNESNNPVPSLTPPQLVSGITLPGTQSNASVYHDNIVYADTRAGNSDVYMYDTLTDVETPVAITGADQVRPKIYGDYVIFEEQGGNTYLKKYDTNTGITTNIEANIIPDTSDFFANMIVYKPNDTLIKAHNIITGFNYTLVDVSSLAQNLDVYGDTVAYDDQTHVFVVDLKTGNVINTVPLTGTKPKIFGDSVIFINSSGLQAYDLTNERYYFNDITASSYDLYGATVAYTNATALTLWDLYNNYTMIINTPASNPSVYDDMLAYENNSDIYYVRMNRSLPYWWVVEDGTANSVYSQYLNYTADQDYVWDLWACDSSFESNACVQAVDTSSLFYYETFIVDRTKPTIAATSPTQAAVVAGDIYIYATVTDENDVASVRFEIRDSTGDLFDEGEMVQFGNTWRSPDRVDFTSITYDDFTMDVYANDTVDNMQHKEVNFTVDADSPWFEFGYGGEEIINNYTTFNDTITSDFIAYNVKNSTVRIIGPLPSTTTRFVQSNVTTVIENHNYSSDISSITWPDGYYRVTISGTNLDPVTRYDYRDFRVDRKFPIPIEAYPNDTIINASDILRLRMNWTDLSLREVHFTYLNSSGIVNEYQNASGSGAYYSDYIIMSDYIDTTFLWNSTAIDGYNRTIISQNSFFVQSDPPEFIGPAIGPYALDEDTADNFTIDLSTRFYDANLDSSLPGYIAGIDNLTYSGHDNCTFVSYYYNHSVNRLTITATGNYSGDCNTVIEAEDYYGQKVNSTNFTVTVSPVNDAPYFNDTIPSPPYDEDNSSGIIFNLVDYVEDIDGPGIDWLTPEIHDETVNFNRAIVDLNYSDDAGFYNFSMQPNVYGTFNIEFGVSDGSETRSQNVTITITQVDDQPTKPGFTNSSTPETGLTPDLYSTHNQDIELTWNLSSDGDGDIVNYSLYYSDDVGASWNLIEAGLPTSPRQHTWHSANFISGPPVSVLLRVNATDNTYHNISDDYGPFTVDNEAATITINSPDTVNVGLPFDANITTSESANCTFTINSTPLFTQSTTDALQHTFTLTQSDINYNVTYNLSINCVDQMGNPSFVNKTFESRLYSLEFIDAYASPSWALQNGIMNITLVVASNNTVTGGTFISLPTGGLPDNRNFPVAWTPALGPNNKYTYLTATAPTSEIGTYNFTIDYLNNGDMSIGSPDIIIEDIYEVFEAVNQTLNIQ